MKIDFLTGLALLAKLNTREKAADYFGISTRTWQRWLDSGDIRRAHYDALRARAGYITAPGWQDFRIIGERIYSPDQNFIHRHEIANMWLYRQIKEFNDIHDRTPQQGDLFQQAK
jgi:hypothetical protein